MFKTLIVEDNDYFRQSLKDILTERFPSMIIEEASNGEEALQKVKTLLPHLIFMDIKLPGENGLELTKKIKAAYDYIMILIITNYDLPEYREAAFKHGANYFLPKGSLNEEGILRLVNFISLEQGIELN
ncbi:MAG: response regulator transcription factor [Candidatus Tectomicrobia bacterium]|uniref:Response regulator transcription factor n=1 Tax=Tectimicrobiota bacterium TaxID=2528274 RepID=A0A933LQW0_UNCTE|nr:response regulator transcription factor [Candidatus Tectomicrobia bacterium]